MSWRSPFPTPGLKKCRNLSVSQSERPISSGHGDWSKAGRTVQSEPRRHPKVGCFPTCPGTRLSSPEHLPARGRRGARRGAGSCQHPGSPRPSGPEVTHPWTSHRGQPVNPLHHSHCYCPRDPRSREGRVYLEGSMALLAWEPCALPRMAGCLGASSVSVSSQQGRELGVRAFSFR